MTIGYSPCDPLNDPLDVSPNRIEGAGGRGNKRFHSLRMEIKSVTMTEEMSKCQELAQYFDGLGGENTLLGRDGQQVTMPRRASGDRQILRLRTPA